mmetsp:Transcript_10293/g.34978  ORF Transcript_10293/g.34978 Transcript_10293/m.34978 type:complete len:210 (-) Transcript_10293:3769-4398(-)
MACGTRRPTCSTRSRLCWREPAGTASRRPCRLAPGWTQSVTAGWPSTPTPPPGSRRLLVGLRRCPRRSGGRWRLAISGFRAQRAARMSGSLWGRRRRGVPSTPAPSTLTATPSPARRCKATTGGNFTTTPCSRFWWTRLGATRGHAWRRSRGRCSRRPSPRGWRRARRCTTATTTATARVRSAAGHLCPMRSSAFVRRRRGRRGIISLR